MSRLLDLDDDGVASASASADAERNGTHPNRFTPPPNSFESARPARIGETVLSRELPSDADAEENLIAALFVDSAEVLSKCADAGLTTSSFTSPRLAAVFGAACELNDEREPVSTISLIHRLKGHEAFDGLPIMPEILALEKQSATTAHVKMLVRSIRGAELLRRAHGAALQAMEEVFKCSADDAERMLEGQQARLKHITDSASSPSDLMDRVFDPKKLLPRPPAIYTIADIGICTRGNLTTIYAQSKAGKSSFIAAMIAATMLPGTSSADTLGVKGPNYGHAAVLHFDTEQSTYDWQALVLSILRRAGLQAPPKWFLSFSLAGMEAAKAERFVHAALRHAKKQCGAVHSVFVDGVADLVSSPNNEDDSNALVARLHGAAIEHDCAIVNILHLNPASKDKTDKGRGHLGSQLERKSESNLTLKKEGDVTMVVAEGRQRGKPIPEKKQPCFKWSDEHEMHRSCALPEDETKSVGRPESWVFSTFKSVFPSKAENPLPLTQLVPRLSANKPISAKQLYPALKRWEEEGCIESFQIQGQPRKYRCVV